MPLLKDGRLSQCERVFLADDETVADWSLSIVTLRRLLAEADRVPVDGAKLAVRLSAGEDPAQLEPFLRRLALIEVDFPKYTDGRGYSVAQLLRRRYGWRGELRAVGDVLRDQLGHMARSGFNAMRIECTDPEQVFEDATGALSLAYQPAADDSPTIIEMRARRALREP